MSAKNETVTMSAEQLAALMAKVEMMETMIATQEAERQEAENRKKRLEETGGFIDGHHPIGFDCLVKPDADPDNLYQVFRLQERTAVLRLPFTYKTTGGKTASIGPELMIFEANCDLAYSIPSKRDCLAAWIGFPTGAESSKLRCDKIQIAAYRMAIGQDFEGMACLVCDGSDFERLEPADMVEVVREEYDTWFDLLSPAKTTLSHRQSKLARLGKR